MRTGFRHGDLVAVGHTFENWDVKDQVFVARQEDDTVHCYTESRQIQIDEHLPFTAVHGVDPGDAMAVGNIWEGACLKEFVGEFRFG